MKPKFIQPAFIRKNTPELRKELEELGYAIMYGYDTGFIITNPEFGVAFLPVGPKVEVDEDSNREYIDCGTNEDLFLAIASLREDTDVNQWFIMDVEVYNDIPMNTWFKATSIEGGKHIGTQIDPMYCHKATVSELIEYFKKKGETK